MKTTYDIVHDSSKVGHENGGGGELTSLPILILNIHERCNCRCIMCDIWKRAEGEEVAVPSLERHRESIRKLGVRQVVLTGGEPLLHSDLSSLCTFFSEIGTRITLLTTGLLLKKRAELVASHVDELIVSIDGPEEIHDEVRRVKLGYQLIREGVAAVRNLRTNMPIHGRCTVQKANHKRLREIVDAAKSLQLDSISFLSADVTSQAFNRTLVWPGERQREISLTLSELEALEEEVELLIAQYRDDLKNNYVVEPAEKLRRIPRRFREHLGQLPAVAPICNAPWVSAVVEVDGSVRPCFFHPTIGDLRSTTLEDVVNGELARSFRRALNVAEDETCRRCVCSLNYKPAQSL